MQYPETLTLFIFLLFMPKGFNSAKYSNDSTVDQLMTFAWNHPYPVGIMTTSHGAPVAFQETQTINTRLLLNNFFVESMTHLARERIPERVVHAKGTGAFGYFKVTNNLSDISKAKLFNTVGKTTPIAVRFSLVIQRPGGSDLSREVRGMAVKFYTEEGNYDYVGITPEMFQLKDPLFFPTFAHAFHKNPKTQVIDANSRWDYLTSRPETLLMAMRFLDDRGIPDGYRYMPSFTIHTFELINYLGERTYARFHLLPDLGLKNLTTAEAARIQGEDLDYATRDLYNAIAEGNYPTWSLSVQTVPENEVRNVKFDIFDVTRYWPVKMFPLRPVGTLKLNRNPKNQFAEIEQLAFNPGNLVPGIRGIDSLFEARAFAYREANIHRLGINFNKIPVNYPFKTIPRTYNRDGSPPVLDNQEDTPNYYPNSFNGPVPDKDNRPPPVFVYTDPSVNNFDQAAELYHEKSEGEKCRLVENIVKSLSPAEVFIQNRAVKLFKLISTELGNRIEYNLNLSTNNGMQRFFFCDFERDEAERDEGL